MNDEDQEPFPPDVVNGAENEDAPVSDLEGFPFLQAKPLEPGGNGNGEDSRSIEHVDEHKGGVERSELKPAVFNGRWGGGRDRPGTSIPPFKRIPLLSSIHGNTSRVRIGSYVSPVSFYDKKTDGQEGRKTGSDMNVTEITVRTALVRSGIPGVDYGLNPYLGCGHGCLYCYAAFMTRYARHHASFRWGTFVEAKVNIVQVLRNELSRKRKKGTVMLSTVCDPYQPAEARYGLTRGCLEALRESGWGFDILTRSPLVTRDRDILKTAPGVSVGVTIPTNDESVRKILEPNAPPIESRLGALRKLRDAGIDTWAFIGPMLPMDPAELYKALDPLVNHVFIDRLNYRSKVAGLFRKHGWEYALTERYALDTEKVLLHLFAGKADSVSSRP